MPTISGDDDNNVLTGTTGDDTIQALGGDDLIIASQGADFIDGGDGRDELLVDMSDTSLFAAATGSRTYTITGDGVFDSSGTLNTSMTGVETVELITRGSGDFGDTIDASGWTTPDPNVSLNVRLGDGNDTLIGSDFSDAVTTGFGNNTIDTGGGWDFVFAEFDNSAGVPVYVTGSGGQVTFTQNGAQIDSIVNAESVIAWGEDFNAASTVVDASGLTGYDGLLIEDNNGTNISIGSPGHDIFRAEAGATLGNDVLTGGGGADVYDYTNSITAMNGDTITDFSSDDTIDLRSINNSSGLLATTFIGGAQFSGAAGEYRCEVIDGNTELQVDTDGDGIADQTLTLSNAAVALGEVAPNVLMSFGTSGTQGDDVFNGTPGNDAYYAQGGNDVLNGRGGDDLLDGSAGNDQLRGGGGNDNLYGGDGADFINGGFGDDLIDGGNGSDRAGYYQTDPSLGGVTVNLQLQGVAQNVGSQGWDTLVGIENVSGTPFADVLTGDENDNWLWGSPATIDGVGVSADNNDYLDGAGGNDLLTVGMGNHTLIGGDGVDTVRFTENGAPEPGITVSLFSQDAAQSTGAGSWTLTGIENLSGGVSNDTLGGDDNVNVLAGDLGDDTLNGFGGNDILLGDGYIDVNSDNVITTSNDRGSDGGNDILDGGAGNDQLYGGAGNDTATFASETGGVTAQLYNGGFGEAWAADGYDQLHDIENLTGSSFGDTLIGNGIANVLSGGDGNDALSGGGGNDTLDGGDGNDSLAGGGGNDTLQGGSGNDFLNGGFGNDTIDGGDGFDRIGYFGGSTTGVTVDLRLQGVAQNVGEQGFDTLSNIEGVSGTAFADTLTGDANDNWLWGSASGGGTTNNDTLDGQGGNDLLSVGIGNHTLTGGSGIDTVMFSENGGAEPDITVSLALQGVAQATGVGDWTLDGIENLSGGLGNDALTGDGGDNVLAGYLGNDSLAGGAGNDTLYGDGFIATDNRPTGGSGPITTFTDATQFDPAAVDGNDALFGGDGDDQLYGGGGNDQLVGMPATTCLMVAMARISPITDRPQDRW